MTPVVSVLLSLIILSLGLLAVILSFLVPDRKKSLISLGLAGLIIVISLVQLGKHSMERHRWNKRISEMQQNRRADLDQIRQKLKERATEAGSPAEGSSKK